MAPETLSAFFGEDSIPAVLTDRINNEYSHLSGVFERGATPVEVPEMQIAAKQIIERLKQDRDQFTSLMKSVGASSDNI
jgi:2-keto-3-deoxy-6-phosphogluconate aldolase